MELKAGSKLHSAVCDTDTIVIKGSGDVALTCGGAPMVATRGELGALDAAFAEGTVIGKRYTNADGSIELLCVKAGKGSLAVNGELLKIKTATPLPSSD